MGPTRTPALVGLFNVLSLGLFKFYWLNRTLTEIRKDSPGIDKKVLFAKIFLWVYLVMSILAPMAAMYLMTTEVIERDGSTHYGLLSNTQYLVMKNLWQLPAFIVMVLTLLSYKGYCDLKGFEADHFILAILGFASILQLARYLLVSAHPL